MGKNKISRKGRAKIIATIISSIALILVACIGLIGKNETFYLGIPNRTILHVTQTSIISTCNSLSEHACFEIKSINSKTENNSGINITGNENTVIYNPENSNTEKEEHVTLTGEMWAYIGSGDVENERINIYAGEEDTAPLYDFQLKNENNVTIDIKDIFIEVLDYKKFNEFIVKNAASGADLLDIIYWRCNITPEKRKYHVALTGTDENNTEDLSRTQYVSLKASDSGKFHLKIFPNTPGLYEAKVIIEYTSYENKTKEVVSENIKFIYDPYAEVVTEFNGTIYSP